MMFECEFNAFILQYTLTGSHNTPFSSKVLAGGRMSSHSAPPSNEMRLRRLSVVPV